MQFHSTLVTFVNGKLQGIVARTLAGKSRQASVPRLIIGRVNHSASNTCLKQNRVDANLLQLVEYMSQLVLLTFYRPGRLCVTVRPVDTPYGCKPYGAHFVFGLCHGAERGKQHYKQCVNISHLMF